MFGLDESFKALADPTRRSVLRCLRERPMSAGELAERVQQSPSALSFHLRSLKAAGLVYDRRDGQHVVYSLNTSVVEDFLRMVLDQFGQDRAKRRKPGSGNGTDREKL